MRKYHQCEYVSSTHHMINPSRPSPGFLYCKWQKWVWRPGNECTF